MFGEEKQSEDLKAFEAELAALRPRAEGLDPRWRFLLAQEAALNQNLSADEALAAGRSICSRCGAVISGRRDKRRWAWPAAFSAMTTVAAVLLAALMVRVEPRSAAPTAEGNVSPTAATPFAKERVDPSSLLAAKDLPRRETRSGADETAYLNVRDRVLRLGVESWKSPPSPAAATTDFPERVLGSRDQMNRLLSLESLFGS
jgi:hypothetical protein